MVYFGKSKGTQYLLPCFGRMLKSDGAALRFVRMCKGGYEKMAFPHLTN